MTDLTQNTIISARWKGRIVAFLSGQALSIFGTMLVQHAIIFYLTLKYESGVIMMISTLCAFLPQIIISAFAGVIADRFNRKILIILSDTVTAASTLLLALVFIGGYQQLWLLFAVMAVRSFGSGFQSPAVTAIIPQLVPKDKLMKINSANGTIQSLAGLVSPVLAAAVLAALSIEVIFFIDVATAAVAVVIMFAIRAPKPPRAVGKTGYFTDLLEGIKYVVKEKPLKTFLLFWALFMFLLTPVIILPSIHISRAFGKDEWRLALSEVLFAVGALISGVIMSAWGGFGKSKLKMLLIGCMGFSVATLLLGFGQNTFTLVFGKPVFGGEFFFVAFVALMFCSGVVMPFVNIPSMTMIQQYVQPELHGRVFGLLQIVSTAAIPIGAVLFGPIADVINIELIFLAAGVLLIALTVLMGHNKNIKEFEKQSVQRALGTDQSEKTEETSVNDLPI